MPIVVVGLACRLAGSATSPDELWQMLSTGKSGWTRGAGTRFNLAAFHHPSAVMNGAFNAQGIHLLKQDISQFDNHMFNISAVEAKAIDPQQRLLLEVAYEAFESAGILRESLRSSETGVYSAVFNHDYESIQARDPEISPSYRFTGTGPALVSNRISYAFDLKGPSVTIDTACSGSLVAVHQACQAIRSGEVRQALVGGTNLILDPEYMTAMSSMQVLSDHGRCYAFDSRAGGFGRGEGVAAIVLKRLDDALRDGDPIRAIIRASATNQDGRTPGITMPSHDAQVEVISKAYAQAGLDPKHTCYVEAHGTGTQAGDKIEAGAIAEIFAHERSNEAPLYVGSVKTNIGHTESTAGLAGLLKAVLVLENGAIPPNLNFASANEAIPLDKWHMKIPQKTIPWPENQIRRVSVNSFGYGGSNAHVILDCAEEYLASNNLKPNLQTCNGDKLQRVDSKLTNGSDEQAGRRRLFLLTHNTDKGIGKLAAGLKRYVTQNVVEHAGLLDNLAHTLSSRRSKLAFRGSITAANSQELISILDDMVKGIIRPMRVEEKPKLCFAFTGQGAQWPRMGRELISVYPIFADALAAADQHLTSLGADWSLLEELNKPKKDSCINEARLSQPCCTAIQIALVDLFCSWNIRPQVVCGHSSGEIAAAYAAGFITASDALSISFHRGDAVHRLRSLVPDLKGGMLAVGLSALEVRKYLRHDSLGVEIQKLHVVIACINSPSSVTLSGDLSPLRDVQRQLEAHNVFNRMLAVDVAYHSHHMDLVRKLYLSSMKDLKPSTGFTGVQMVSSVTGELIDPVELNACYWAENMVSCVRFASALEKAVQFSNDTGAPSTNAVDAIVEIGPHSALAGPIKQSLKTFNAKASGVRYYSALSRDVDSVKTSIQLAGELACLGLDIKIEAINDPTKYVQKATISNLPAYDWHHAVSHWNEGRMSSQYRFRQFPRHDLLGVACNDNIALEPKWRNYIRTAEVPWVKGHVFQGQIIFPASGYICAAIEAVRQVTLSSGRMWKDMVCRFRQINCGSALLIPETSTGIEISFSLRPYTYSARESSSTWKEFRMFSISATGEATEHCRGLVSAEQRHKGDNMLEQSEKIGSTNQLSVDFDLSNKACRRSVDPKRFYKDLKSLGLDYTGPFANITKISAGSRVALCTILTPETKSSMPGMFAQPHCVHPATLDMCFQTPFTGLRVSGDMKNTMVITYIEELDVSSDINANPGTTFLASTSAEPFGAMKYKARVAVADIANQFRAPLIEIKGLVYTSSFETSFESPHLSEHLCHQIKWAMDPDYTKTEDILHLGESKFLETSATRRRDAYDTYAQKVIRTVLPAISAEEELKMEGHHRKLINWMRAHKSETFAESQCESREVIQSLGVDGKMLVRVGDHMLQILKGQVDALTILLKDDLLYQVYSNENTHRCHAQLDEYLRLHSFKNPGMNILEIGGGTAGTTVPVLEAFSTWSDGLLKRTSIKKYVFTDISSGFFEKSKEKLQAWQDVLEFKKLDIEADTEIQGYAEGTFDLIVASNVLHATHSIAQTLQNVRRLLKPGGTLVMVEITEPHMTWPMIVGTLPGWWLGAADGRVDSPSLPSSGWDRVLRKSNFTGVDVEMKDYNSAYEHQLSVLISTATVVPQTSRDQRITVLCNEVENSLADEFCDLVSQTEPDTIVRQKKLSEFEASDDVHVVLLEATSPLISHCVPSVFENIKQMLTRVNNILWITKGATIDCRKPEMAMITGLARTARSENHSLNLVTLDLDPNENSPAESAKHLKRVFDNSFGLNNNKNTLSEFEYAVRDGAVLIPRIVADESANDFVDLSVAKRKTQLQPLREKNRSLELRVETPGLLETLYWADSTSHSQKPGPAEVRIKVGAIPLNFKDLMTGMGQLDGLVAMLIECSGVVEEVGDALDDSFRAGDRVCAVGYKSFATSSNVDYRLVQRIPDGMDSQVAAAIQISYATALYALRDIARLQKGESVLIHSGAGGFGQAAIALAKYMKAGQIYVTVGSSEKKNFIMEKFGIADDHIFSSRTLIFKEGILRLTNGDGVDVILNSLSGDAMFESHKCLSRFGRFVEIGKKDLLTNTRLEMQHFERNVSFSTVDLSMLMEFKPFLMQELLATVFDLIDKQEVTLLSPIITKPISELEPALRLMQTGKHIGKIVMILGDEMELKVEHPRPEPPMLKNDGSYLIIGGTGGLGKAIARHLVKIGARHIIAMSRSGAKDADTVVLVEECRSVGVDVVVHKGSVLSIEDILETTALAGHRSIRGVIQGAMVLKDSSLSNMSYEQWQAAVLPKVQGTLNLHTVFGETLDFFIMLSSGTGIIGSYGQGNYSAGNTFQDAFARWCIVHNFPARTIDLGPVEGEGYAAENEKALEFTLRQGMGVVRLEEVMALIDHAILYPRPKDVAGSQILVATRRADPAAGTDEAAVQRPDPKFTHLWTASSTGSVTIVADGEFDFRNALRSATTHGSAVDAAQTAIINKLSKLLAMPVEDVRPERPLGAYGMDSLISVELRNWMAMQLEAFVQQFELMGAKSIQNLAVMAAERSRLVPTSVMSALNK